MGAIMRLDEGYYDTIWGAIMRLVRGFYETYRGLL